MLANPLGDAKFDTAWQQLSAGSWGQCQNSSHTDRWHTWGRGRVATLGLPMAQKKWFRNHVPTES